MLLGKIIPNAAYAVDWATINPNCVENGVATITGIKCLISNILAAAAPLIVLVAVFMVILGGSKIIMGGDSPKSYEAGIQSLMWAVIGVIGLGFAWFILVAIERFTGANVTQMRFGF
jgi:hypothetical protein